MWYLWFNHNHNNNNSFFSCVLLAHALCIYNLLFLLLLFITKCVFWHVSVRLSVRLCECANIVFGNRVLNSDYFMSCLLCSTYLNFKLTKSFIALLFAAVCWRAHATHIHTKWNYFNLIYFIRFIDRPVIRLIC